MSEKKNPDYSQSAVRLCNPPQVKEALEQRQSLTSHIANLRALLEAYPEWAELQKAEQRLTDHVTYIRDAIDRFGSFQSVETGEYALKQRRESITYKPELVRQFAPEKVIPFVLVETVDSKALEAMVKAGQLAPEQARKCGIIEEKFAYIIK